VDEKGKIACVYSTPSGDDRTLRDIEIPNLNPKELINGEDEKRAFAVNAIYAKQAGQDPDEAWNRAGLHFPGKQPLLRLLYSGAAGGGSSE
jgi:hypothetical protein